MLKEGVICYRVKCEKESETLLFTGDQILAGMLKQMIDERRTRNLKRKERKVRVISLESAL